LWWDVPVARKSKSPFLGVHVEDNLVLSSVVQFQVVTKKKRTGEFGRVDETVAGNIKEPLFIRIIYGSFAG